MPQDPDDLTTDQELDAQQETEQISHSNGDSNRIAAIERNQQVLSLLADPAINQVIQARRAGKPVRVIEDTAETPEPEVDPVDELTSGLEADDPSRETLGKIGKVMGAKLSSRDAEIAELKAQVQQLSGVAQEVQRRDVSDQVAKAQSKFKDFAQYKDTMVELSTKHPGLGVEELYLVAKNKAGKLKLVEQATFSEKPTQHPPRSTSSARRGTPTPPPAQGRKGFNDILTRALKDIDLESAG